LSRRMRMPPKRQRRRRAARLPTRVPTSAFSAAPAQSEHATGAEGQTPEFASVTNAMASERVVEGGVSHRGRPSTIFNICASSSADRRRTSNHTTMTISHTPQRTPERAALRQPGWRRAGDDAVPMTVGASRLQGGSNTRSAFLIPAKRI
jgi:hypothetical protein